jgi:hypothetical protein
MSNNQKIIDHNLLFKKRLNLKFKLTCEKGYRIRVCCNGKCDPILSKCRVSSTIQYVGLSYGLMATGAGYGANIKSIAQNFTSNRLFSTRPKMSCCYNMAVHGWNGYNRRLVATIRRSLAPSYSRLRLQLEASS